MFLLSVESTGKFHTNMVDDPLNVRAIARKSSNESKDDQGLFLPRIF